MTDFSPSPNGRRPSGRKSAASLEALHLLVSELRDDQCDRWRDGEQVRAEDYLRAFPAVANSPEDALVLINGEIQLRREMGEQPTLDEYQRRFPDFAEQLAQLFEVEDALSESAAAIDPPEGQPPEPPRPLTVPGYEILENLGSGGMGVVHKARQTNADRLVALKMILHRQHVSLEERVRFRLEAKAVARLQHPNIVQVFEVGEHDGQPFFSLEFCEGGNLATKLKDQPLPARKAAALLEKVARAMHHAHSRGVVHRDLKPANVLLTSDDVPKITDFGLAKCLDSGGDVSQSGAVMCRTWPQSRSRPRSRRSISARTSMRWVSSSTSS